MEFNFLATAPFYLAFALRVEATAPARRVNVGMCWNLLVVDLGLAATCLSLPWGSVTDPSDQLLTLPVKPTNPTRAETQRDRPCSFLSFDFAVKKGLCHMAYDLK